MQSRLPHSRSQLKVLALIFLAGIGAFGSITRVQSAQADASQATTRLSPLEELRKTFTVHGKPVPPEVFRDMGDGDMADSGSIRVTIDVKAAIGSNLYFDDIKADGDWITQTHKTDADLAEKSSYRFIGTTENKLLVVIASYSSGGSGTFWMRRPGAASIRRAGVTTVSISPSSAASLWATAGTAR
jgi:hypothetical protein